MPPLAQQWAAHTSERHPVAQRLQRAALQAELEARAKGELHPMTLELRRASALAEALDAASRGEDVSAFVELTSHADLLVPCWLAWRRRADSRRHLHEAHVPAVLSAWRIWARQPYSGKSLVVSAGAAWAPASASGPSVVVFPLAAPAASAIATNEEMILKMTIHHSPFTRRGWNPRTPIHSHSPSFNIE